MELDKGGYVLLGVVLTLTIGVLKDVVAAYLKNKRERSYLAVQIIFLLDDFALKCSAVVGDDGTWMGQYGPNGVARSRVAEPEISFSELKGDWKSINPEIVYRLHDLASSIISAKRKVSAEFENSDPPDFSEGFECRQYEYALLGLQSFEISNEFRAISKMPVRVWPHFDPIAHMQNAVETFQERFELRRIAYQKWIDSQK